MKIAQYCDYGYAMTVDAETEVTWRNWDFTKIVNVTHWMPLPAPPGKDNNVPTNEPLTIEQLREMDGEPVWVKVIGKTGIRCDGWCEAEIREKDPFAYVWWPGSEVEDIAKIEDYGKTWACYAYPPAHIDREAWVSVEDRMPKYNIREDGELVSSKILVRCEIEKTVHLVVSKKFYTGRPGEMVHSVFRFYDEWGDIIENVSHWMPLPKPPRPR